MVSAVLADISAQRIEQRIRTLVDFGTRHTASETASDTRGIGAAPRWIERELRACSRDTGGALQVQMRSHVEPAGRRLSKPTEIVNVVATLPGASASVGRERVLVVSGHYDSRNTDVNDATGIAPGANDDASGTAVVMELACAMAKHRFDATLVFMAVAGEEQGLLGAAQMAREARRDGVAIEAMITNDIVGSSRGDFGQHDPKRLRLRIARRLVVDEEHRPAQHHALDRLAGVGFGAALQVAQVAGDDVEVLHAAPAAHVGGLVDQAAAQDALHRAHQPAVQAVDVSRDGGAAEGARRAVALGAVDEVEDGRGHGALAGFELDQRFRWRR